MCSLLERSKTYKIFIRASNLPYKDTKADLEIFDLLRMPFSCLRDTEIERLKKSQRIQTLPRQIKRSARKSTR